jgi:hypothetical protein
MGQESGAMGRPRVAREWWLAVLLLAILSLAANKALGQSAKPAMTVPEIRACICQEQKIGFLRAATADKDAAYHKRQDQVNGLTAQINQMTATMNPTDNLAQDQLSELIELRARVQRQIRDTTLPELQQSTNVLNLAVQSYNTICADRTIYDVDDVEARKNLTCPKP